MRILLTGATGYIGIRLIPVLLEKGHEVICLVRDKQHFRKQIIVNNRLTVISGDLLKPESMSPIRPDIDVAYYLVHGTSQNLGFEQLEAYSAHNFVTALNSTHCKQIIYLNSICHDEYLPEYPPHHIEDILKTSNAALTVLHTSMIIGRGSALFEIIRGVTEKLPVIPIPRWINNSCQPIAIRDVLGYLEDAALNEKTYNRDFDIGGPDILTVKQLMLIYAKVRKIKRRIITVPFLPAKVSAYWLHLATSTSYTLIQNLVDSMKYKTICRDHAIDEIIPHQCLHYEEALKLAFNKSGLKVTI